jgi:hypothetical protein
MIVGKPTIACTCSASSRECARALRGDSRPDPRHGLLELLAVLGLVDRLALRADHLDAEFLEHAFAREVERAIERRSARPSSAAAPAAAPSR